MTDLRARVRENLDHGIELCTTRGVKEAGQ
jgi:hypothetical protein